MINHLISASIKHRILVLFAVLVLVLGGGVALQNLPVDVAPDITNVQVQVLTSASALAPVDVEQQVTAPLEIGLRGIPGVKQLRSISKFGLSLITVIFDDSTNTYFARQQVFERLQQLRDQLPVSVSAPQLGPVSTGLGEIYQYTLQGENPKVSLSDLRSAQDWIVRRQLLGVSGVAEGNSYGGLKKRYEIQIDPDKLIAYGISMQDVLRCVGTNNENAGGAFIEHTGEQYLLRGIGTAKTPEQLEQIVLKTTDNGIPVLVRDVSAVVDGAETRQGAVLADGKGETTAGVVLMLKGQNTRAVVQSVKDRVTQIQQTLPKDIKLVSFYDRSQLIDRTINTVQSNLVEGSVLVVIILLALLGSWRAALLVASVIPLSMLFAAICMNAFQISGNLMSLGALDFGLIVDGAVVMAENSIRKLALAKAGGSQQSDVSEIVKSACFEVGRPVVFALVIVATVYIPILSLTGVEGKLFGPMALTVLFTLLGSLLLSLLYIPAVLSFIPIKSVSSHECRMQTLATNAYRHVLNFVSRFRLQVVSIALSMVVLSLATFPMLGAEFLPRLDEGAIAIQMQQLPGVSLSQSIAATTQAERIIKAFPEVETVVSKIGRAEVATDPMGVDTADIYVGLKPLGTHHGNEWRTDFIARLSSALSSKVPQASFSFSQPIELRTAELLAGVRSDVAVKLFGDNPETLKEISSKIEKSINTVAGASDVKVEPTAGVPELTITPDRNALARYGINVQNVNDLVETIVAGKDAGQIYENDRKIDIVARLKPEAGIDVNSIRSLMVTSNKGQAVPLSSVAKVEITEGPAQICREDGRRRIVVEANVRGRDIGSFVQEARARINRDVTLPPGYYVTWGGQFENLERASKTLITVVPITLLFIFAMLLFTFGSSGQALLIFTGVPFALTGGILALALRGMPFSISAGVGFIALSGVAVLNGVVMVSCINALRKDYGLEEAALQGALSRLRPVLMTALVASLGFVPMAVSTSAGAEVQQPLATVVIGGLITSTLLTLVLLPSLYVIFEKVSKKMHELSTLPQSKSAPKANAV